MEFPKKKYQIIYADPPWHIRWQGSNSIGTKPLNYPTMTMVELVEFGDKVKSISEDCSKLFMWTTNGFLPEALGLLKHWGFQYDKLWTWCKPTGAGGHPRNATEHLIEASRGALNSIGRHEKAKNNWFTAPTSGHSVKPEEAYKLIEYCYPNYTKIELFARKRRGGWDAWGNETPKEEQKQLNEVNCTIPPKDKSSGILVPIL
jgi:N6-adenosine-specific RNA methylase IME4